MKRNQTHLLSSDYMANLKVENIKKKWDGLCFLDGLKGVHKRNVALAYELGSLYLLDPLNENKYSRDTNTVIYPIIRKVFSDLYQSNLTISEVAINVIDLINDFAPKYMKNESKFNKIVKVGEKDLSAEFIGKYCRKYIDKNIK